MKWNAFSELNVLEKNLESCLRKGFTKEEDNSDSESNGKSEW